MINNMEKLNIAEMLKDCPRGMELDCTSYGGVVTFEQVTDSPAYPIIIKIEYKDAYFTEGLTKYGQTCKTPYNKCVIFPKDKTTWEGFQRPFKDGDIVATTEGSWVGITLGGEVHKYIPTYCVITSDNEFIAYFNHKEEWAFSRLATEEEKQKLFQAIKDNGYRWNAVTKTLEKLPKFKAGDVLVSRAGNIVLCSNIDDNQVIHYHCILSPPNSFWIKNDIGVGKSFHCTLATDAEKQKLFNKLKSAGYKYNPQTNKLEKLIEPKFKVGDRIKEKKAHISGIITDISDGSYKVEYEGGGVAYANIEFQDGWELVPNKFDITTLKEFDKVLVRDYDTHNWRCALYERYIKTEDNMKFATIIGRFRQCIPFEGNQHLLGTTNKCVEYYKTWE